jgi:hypothetical protein
MKLALATFEDGHYEFGLPRSDKRALKGRYKRPAIHADANGWPTQALGQPLERPPIRRVEGTQSNKAFCWNPRRLPRLRDLAGGPGVERMNEEGSVGVTLSRPVRNLSRALGVLAQELRSDRAALIQSLR